jgi:hypothetical protein
MLFCKNKQNFYLPGTTSSTSKKELAPVHTLKYFSLQGSVICGFTTFA